jgi:uncharacterized membrane protein YjfL (UPF0719 family)
MTGRRVPGTMPPMPPAANQARSPAVAGDATAATVTRATTAARALTRAGALAGGFVVIAAAVSGSGTGERFGRDLPWMALFTLAGLIEAGWAATLLDRFVLRGGLGGEIARGNLAAGLTSAGHRLAAGWVASRCLYGADLHTLAIGAAFVAIASVTLLVFQLLHRLLTHYADDQEIRGGNSAVALSNVGLTLALGIIVGHAAEGSFAGWAASLRGYAGALVLALALYPVRQLVVCRLILGFSLRLRGREIDRAIAADRDHVLAGIEGLVYVATALLVTGLF